MKLIHRKTEGRFLKHGSISFAILVLLVVPLILSKTAKTTDALGLRTLSTVKNLRPVVPNRIYRSASLDQISQEEAEKLLQECSLIIDLRNGDEIDKGASERPDGGGAAFLYETLQRDSSSSYGTMRRSARWINVPLLKDTDKFWDSAIDRMDSGTRIAATLQTVFQGGALDRAAARFLEQGGCSMLYTILLETSPKLIGQVLDACLESSSRDGGVVLFHCQKGKDRTGIIGMLLQHCIGEMDAEIIEAYAISGDLLGGEECQGSVKERGRQASSSASTVIDWSYFRGSPPDAMRETLEWMRKTYGSVDTYLDVTGFGPEKRQKLREILIS